MKRAALIPAAWLADQLVGDPEHLPHPVRLIGAAISRGEALLLHEHDRAPAKLLAGAVLSVLVVVATYQTTRLLLRLAPMLELPLAATTLAARNLQDEAAAVLAAPTLEQARRRLARIVGRDTGSLPEEEVARALIETLAESASDGIVAPLFYLALGGVPLAMAYKAVNTLDSMIGHRDRRYEHFGTFAARLDDCANYVPARLTALALAAVAHSPESLRTWRRFGDHHASPNAGQPEAAMAGALGVRLGGPNTYAGEAHPARVIAPQFAAPTLPQARRAMELVAAATVLAVACFTLLTVRRSARCQRVERG